MIYRLNDRLVIEKLLSLPETGMGYQIIKANTRINYSFKENRYIACNAQSLIPLREINKPSSFIKSHLLESQDIEIDPSSITLIEKNYPNIRKSIASSYYLPENKERGAKDNPIECANGKEVFVRLSAFKIDRRIDFVRKRLRPGSFTTTCNDYKDCLRTNDNPINRYALPNSDKIEWAFYIQPEKYDILQRGIVQPVNNREGGGKEAYFKAGTSDYTFFARREYGK